MTMIKIISTFIILFFVSQASISQKTTINFEWSNDSLNGLLFEKTAMHIPIHFENDTNTYYFQLDTGSDQTFLYSYDSLQINLPLSLLTENVFKSDIGLLNAVKLNTKKWKNQLLQEKQNDRDCSSGSELQHRLLGGRGLVSSCSGHEFRGAGRQSARNCWRVRFRKINCRDGFDGSLGIKRTQFGQCKSQGAGDAWGKASLDSQDSWSRGCLHFSRANDGAEPRLYHRVSDSGDPPHTLRHGSETGQSPRYRTDCHGGDSKP